MNHTKPQIVYDTEERHFQCAGDWSILTLGGLLKQFKASSLPKDEKLFVSGKLIHYFDSAGAMALFSCVRELEKRNNQVEIIEFSETHLQLLNLVEDKSPVYQIQEEEKKNVFYRLGEESYNKLKQVHGLVILVGGINH